MMAGFPDDFSVKSDERAIDLRFWRFTNGSDE